MSRAERQEQMRRVSAMLGDTLLAFTLGVNSTRYIHYAITGEVVISDEAAARLDLIEKAIASVTDGGDSQGTAVIWFMGLNQLERTTSPARLIRDHGAEIAARLLEYGPLP